MVNTNLYIKTNKKPLSKKLKVYRELSEVSSKKLKKNQCISKKYTVTKIKKKLVTTSDVVTKERLIRTLCFINLFIFRKFKKFFFKVKKEKRVELRKKKVNKEKKKIKKFWDKSKTLVRFSTKKKSL